MSIPMLVGLLLALAVTASSARQLVRRVRRPAASRPAAWRMVALLLLQPVCAAVLYCTLFPPARTIGQETLVVLTAGADALVDRRAFDTRVVAFPEAGTGAGADVERVPDLATALRMYPGTTRLHVIGSGLEARDVDAANGLALEFEAAPLPRGIIGLHAPGHVVAGGTLPVAGRAHGVDGAVVELLDPSGTVVDRRDVDAEGRFRVQAIARAEGPAEWRLHLREGEAADAPVIEEARVPVDVITGATTGILLLAGAPNPEVKYLRRWALDAGLALHSRMALGAGAVLGDGPVALDAGTLAGFDVVIVDDRAWNALATAERDALLGAVDQGLGLLYRIVLPPDAGTRRALHGLGFTLEDDAAAATVDVHLEAGPASVSGALSGQGEGGRDAPPPLARQAPGLAATDGIVLLRDRDGLPIALWRGAGRGRLAAWNLDQSYRLVLTGHGARHARLWSDAVGTVARARAATPPRLVGTAREGRRMTVCGLAPGAALIAEDGTRLRPLPDPAADRCAAAWPAHAGWYRIVGGDGAAEPSGHLHVHGYAALPGVDAHERQEATLRLAATGGTAGTDAGISTGPAATATAAGLRWPWFLAWLTVAALLWWLERARFGLHPRSAAAPANA